MREKTRALTALAALVAGAVLAMAPPAAAYTTTTTSLVSNPNPSTSGQAVTLTATVTGADPTGVVVFGENDVTLGVVAVTAGAATLVVSSLPVGSHGLFATYSGDANNDFSVGTLTQTVNAAPPASLAPLPVVTVKPPKVKLVASTTKASVGDMVRLRWRSKHADVVMASGDWTGAQKTKGSLAVRISERGKHVFKLTVQNAAGAKSATVKVLAARKAKALELVVTEELTLVGSDVELTADGLAKGEDYTVRLDGKPIMTGKADKKGDVARTFTLAKTTAEGALPLTITGSNPSRVGTAVLNVIAPEDLRRHPGPGRAAEEGRADGLRHRVGSSRGAHRDVRRREADQRHRRRRRHLHLHVRCGQGGRREDRQGDRGHRATIRPGDVQGHGRGLGRGPTGRWLMPLF